MKVQIDGRELRVVKSTNVLAEWQRQSGKSMAWLGEPDGQVYALAFMAFCALQNAGFEPKWGDLLDVDTDEWKFIQEPNDVRGGGAVEPVSSLGTSEVGGVGGAHIEPVKPASKRSTKPKAGSKSK